jgi:hypothetical protein
MKIGVLTAGATVLWATAVSADTTLFSFDVQDIGGGVGNVSQVQVSIEGTNIQQQLYTVLANHPFSPSDAGSTFHVTALNDPSFALFASTITDGQNELFGYLVNDLPGGGSSGIFGNESGFFAAGTHSFGPGQITSIGPISGPDFAGYQITQLIFTINTFTLTSGGGNYSVDFEARAQVLGVVPEPSSFAICLAGGFLAWIARRRPTDTGRD